MTLYINETTNKYPRFQGDVDLDPEATWAIVEETEIPASTSENTLWVEDTPVKEDGIWKRTWKEIPIPPKDRASEIERAKRFGIDLELLGVKE